MKKLFLINLLLTGIFMSVLLTSAKDAGFGIPGHMTHHFSDGVFGRYIVPDQFRICNEQGYYIVHQCDHGLYFNCITCTCDWPANGCQCTAGL